MTFTKRLRKGVRRGEITSSSASGHVRISSRSGFRTLAAIGAGARSVNHDDALTREQELSSKDRLHFHQQQSGPLMSDLYRWIEVQLRSGGQSVPGQALD